MNQTGVRSTGSLRHALMKRELFVINRLSLLPEIAQSQIADHRVTRSAITRSAPAPHVAADESQ
jgi:hypothetical protein